MRLLRKISVAKWKASLKVGVDHLSADAITGCLRTSDNTLSVWQFSNDEEARRSLLALGASLSKIETINYVTLNSEELEGDDLVIKSSLGQTAAVESNSLHQDIINLDHSSLERVAIHVRKKVQFDEFETLSKGELKKLLCDGIASGALDVSRLDKKLLAELEKARA